MNGVVSVIEGQNSCRTGSEVGALTYSGILVDDFIPDKPGRLDSAHWLPFTVCIRGRTAGCHQRRLIGLCSYNVPVPPVSICI